MPGQIVPFYWSICRGRQMFVKIPGDSAIRGCRCACNITNSSRRLTLLHARFKPGIRAMKSNENYCQRLEHPPPRTYFYNSTNLTIRLSLNSKIHRNTSLLEKNNPWKLSQTNEFPTAMFPEIFFSTTLFSREARARFAAYRRQLCARNSLSRGTEKEHAKVVPVERVRWRRNFGSNRDHGHRLAVHLRNT